MTKLQTLLRRFARDPGGATSIEYAIIASGLSIVIITAVSSLGTAVKDLVTKTYDSLK